ncbi:MAG: hypothetical protein U0R52_03335 [Solirubrobacterales bacterium]
MDRLARLLLRRARRAVAATVAALDRTLTPARGTFLVALACAASLVASQFVQFRGVEIGQPGYAGVEPIATAPQLGTQTPADHHGYALIALAVVAVVAAGFAAFARRRSAAAIVAAAGIAGVGVVLLSDLPQGLHAGLTGAQFAGANPVLKNGFWAELAACAGLVVCGLALSLPGRRSPGRAGGRQRRERERRRPAKSKSPSLAGSGT